MTRIADTLREDVCTFMIIPPSRNVSDEYKAKVRQWPRGFQEVKVPRFHDNGTGRW